MRTTWMLGALLLVGCRGEGKWDVTASGGEFAESGMTSDDFVDSCAAGFGAVEVNYQSVELFDEDGETGGGIDVPSPLDLAGTGPHTVGLVDVLEGSYDTFKMKLGTGTTPGVRLVGTLTCQAGTVDFDWSFDGPMAFTCDDASVDITNKGDDDTLFLVTPDAIFSPTASDVDPARQGLHLLALDADHNGDLTLDELEAVTGTEAGLTGVSADMRTHVTDRVRGMFVLDNGGTCSASGG